MAFAWRGELARRPWWVNTILVFCLYMTVIYVPWDLFWKPLDQDDEVWFGILLSGYAAKLGAAFHWAVYAALSYGFYRLRPWVWLASAAYVLQIAFSMWLWNLLDPRGLGWVGGIASALPFLALALLLFRRRAKPAV